MTAGYGRSIYFRVFQCYNTFVITYSSADDGYFILLSISKNHAWVRIPLVLSDGNSVGRAEKIYGPVVAVLCM